MSVIDINTYLDKLHNEGAVRFSRLSRPRDRKNKWWDRRQVFSRTLYHELLIKFSFSFIFSFSLLPLFTPSTLDVDVRNESLILFHRCRYHSCTHVNFVEIGLSGWFLNRNPNKTCLKSCFLQYLWYIHLL